MLRKSFLLLKYDIDNEILYNRNPFNDSNEQSIYKNVMNIKDYILTAWNY